MDDLGVKVAKPRADRDERRPMKDIMDIALLLLREYCKCNMVMRITNQLDEKAAANKQERRMRCLT